MKQSMLIVASAALGAACTLRAHAQDCIDTVWSEDFDAMTPGGLIIEEQACYPFCPPGFSWQRFNDPKTNGSAEASDDYGNPGVSGRIVGDPDWQFADDLVHTFHDLGLDSGAWKFSTDLFVPLEMTGSSYFVLLRTYDISGGPFHDWATQVRIDGDRGRVESEFDEGSVPLVRGEWKTLEVVISFDSDEQEVRYDGQVVHDERKYWFCQTCDVPMFLEAVNLFGNDASPVYYDNFSVCSISADGACCFRDDPCIVTSRAECEALQGGATFMGLGRACEDIECAVYGPNGWEIDDLFNAAPPFTWDGDTCNDYPGIPSNPDCEFFPEDCSECDLNPDSQDQAWAIDIPWAGTWTFSTCGLADFDTQLFVSTVATCMADVFNDDCTERIPHEEDSELSVFIDPEATPTAFVTLEAFQIECGLYRLLVGAPCPRFTPTPGAIDETLGPCFDNDSDPENVGCNSAEPTFSDLQCGQTRTGTIGNFRSDGAHRRDMDWYRLELETTATVTMTAVGNYPQVSIIFAQLAPPPEECNEIAVLAVDETAVCNETTSITLDLGPGSYVPVITTAFVDPGLTPALGGVSCGSDDDFGLSRYEFALTCCAISEAPGDANGDGVVNFADVLVVIAAWGEGGPVGNLECDAEVGFADLLSVLSNWGL